VITLKRLDLIRQSSPALADELANVQTQLNAQPSLKTQTQSTVGSAGAADALPATPSGYVEIVIGGTTYVLPFYAKD
jgi:hypothetical protein